MRHSRHHLQASHLRHALERAITRSTIKLVCFVHRCKLGPSFQACIIVVKCVNDVIEAITVKVVDLGRRFTPEMRPVRKIRGVACVAPVTIGGLDTNLVTRAICVERKAMVDPDRISDDLAQKNENLSGETFSCPYWNQFMTNKQVGNHDQTMCDAIAVAGIAIWALVLLSKGGKGELHCSVKSAKWGDFLLTVGL